MSGNDFEKIKIISEPGFPLHPDTVYHWDGENLFSNFETVNNSDTDLDAAIKLSGYL